MTQHIFRDLTFRLSAPWVIMIDTYSKIRLILGKPKIIYTRNLSTRDSLKVETLKYCSVLSLCKVYLLIYIFKKLIIIHELFTYDTFGRVLHVSVIRLSFDPRSSSDLSLK